MTNQSEAAAVGSDGLTRVPVCGTLVLSSRVLFIYPSSADWDTDY